MPATRRYRETVTLSEPPLLLAAASISAYLQPVPLLYPVYGPISDILPTYQLSQQGVLKVILGDTHAPYIALAKRRYHSP